MATSKRNLPARTGNKLNAELNNALSVIDKKLKDLGVNPDVQVLNHISGFKMNENDSNSINILTCADVNYLIKALAKMRRVLKEFEETAENIGLTTYPVCHWMGYPIKDWIHNLTIRVKIAGNQATINQLSAKRTELSTFLSADQRLAATLEGIKDLLK